MLCNSMENMDDMDIDLLNLSLSQNKASFHPAHLLLLFPPSDVDNWNQYRI